MLGHAAVRRFRDTKLGIRIGRRARCLTGARGNAAWR